MSVHVQESSCLSQCNFETVNAVMSAKCEAAGVRSASKAKTAKQLLAEQVKDERRLKKETEQKESDNRFTSPELIRSIEDCFGPIDFDPCWHEASAVNPRIYLDVREGHNGLRDEWCGRLAFVNPPWSAQDKWVKRAHDQWSKGYVGTVICLVPAKTDAKFFHNVLSKDADVYFVEGRPHFFKEDGTSGGTMVSVMLVMFGTTREQRTRFAKRVKGSWWIKARGLSRASKKGHTGSHRITYDYKLASCVAPYRGGDACRTSFCVPTADATAPAGF